MALQQEDILKIAQLVPGNISIYRVSNFVLIPLYISKKVASLSDMTIEEYKEFIKDNACNIVIAEDKKLVSQALIPVITKRITGDLIYRIYNKKSGYIWIHAQAQYIGCIDNDPVILTTFINTTLETNGLSNLVNHSNNSVYVIDEETFELLYVNEVALKRWGKKEYKSEKCFSFISDQKQQCSWCPLFQLKGNSIHFEESYIAEKDKWFKIDCQKISWFGRKAIACFLLDITESKRTQLLLEKSNDSLNAVINNIPVGICIFKKIKTDIYCIATNPSFKKIQGITNFVPNKKISRTFFNKIYPGESAHFRTNFFAIFEKGYNVFDYRTINGHNTASDGTITPSYIWLHLEGYATEQPDGAQLAYVCFTNITLEKEAEQEANRLRRIEEEHYTHTIDGIISSLPKTIGSAHLDLTQNFYSNCHTTAINKQAPIECGSIDYLIAFIADRMFDIKARKCFKELFNRDALFATFAKGTSFFSFDYQHCNTDGCIKWETISINLARNPKNEDLEAVLYVVDSEEKITLEQINKHLLSEDYDFIAVIHTVTGFVTFITINDPLTTPHQYIKYEDAYHDAFIKMLPKKEVNQALSSLSLSHIQKELKQKDSYIYSFTIIDANKKKLRKQTRYSYLDNTKQKILFTRTDITESTRVETEQKDKLEKALATAEKANEMKSAFLSTVSHDMRTPLNGIIGYTTIALQQDNLEKTRSYLKKIQTASDSLLLLINDTLDLARIENGNEIFKPEPINTLEFINNLITTVKPSMDKKNIHFVTNIDNAGNLYLSFDRMRMEKIMLNLLSNATKFTPENGTVKLSIECLSVKENKLNGRIIIEDTGCGMSKDFISKAFEPFTQERTPTTANIGGSGLGLSIVKRLVEMMGGHIEVKSEQGKGSTFTVYLTYDIVSVKGMQTNVKTIAQTDNTLLNKNILLCEDNAVNREIAIALLESKGLHVTVATNGQEGVDVFTKSTPGTFNCILMDIRMPIMNGYDATTTIRSLKRDDASNIPIIAMTADAYEEDVKHALSVGMNAHLAKPIDAQKLFSLLSKYC